MTRALRNLALALIVLFGGLAALLSRGDGPPPDDADLMQTAPPIPEHENGYVTLEAAAALLQWPDGEALNDRLLAMASGADWDGELAARVLADNERSLATFARVARSAAFRSPADASSARPSALAAVQLARLLGIRARSATRGGDPAAAVEDALLALQVGNRIGADPHGGVLAGELGIFVGEIGLDAIADALPALELDTAASQSLTRELEAHRIDPSAWRGILAASYRAERRDLPTAARAPLDADTATPWARRIAAWLPDHYTVQPNNSIAALAAQVRERQSRADQPCDRVETEPPPLTIADLLRPNAIGRRYVAAARSRTRIDAERCAYHTRIELIRAAIALHAFEAERGMLPPSLEALVPAYLDAMPSDGFSGDALRFHRRARVIYSIGSDGVDAGGAPIAGDTDDREPRFELPPLEPG
jgi:hypothetical protein